VRDVRLHMPGRWELYFDIGAAPSSKGPRLRSASTERLRNGSFSAAPGRRGGASPRGARLRRVRRARRRSGPSPRSDRSPRTRRRPPRRSLRSSSRSWSAPGSCSTPRSAAPRRSDQRRRRRSAARCGSGRSSSSTRASRAGVRLRLVPRPAARVHGRQARERRARPRAEAHAVAAERGVPPLVLLGRT
jgi:hypothetical protein